MKKEAKDNLILIVFFVALVLLIFIGDNLSGGAVGLSEGMFKESRPLGKSSDFVNGEELRIEEDLIGEKEEGYERGTGGEEIEGILEIATVDDFEQELSEIVYYLRTDTNEYYKLLFEKIPEVDSGFRIRVIGEVDEEKKEIIVEDIEFISPGPRDEPEDNLGEQRTAVVLVNFLDNQLEPVSPSEMADTMQTVDEYYQETSYQQTWLNTNVYGYYTLGNYDDYEDDMAVLNEIIWDEDVDADIDWTQVDRLVLTGPGICTFAQGWAFLGKRNMETPDGQARLGICFISSAYQYIAAEIISHELGHTMKLRHASDMECSDKIIGLGENGRHGCYAVEYGDFFDVMGRAEELNHFNVHHKERIYWLNDDIIEMDGSNFGTYQIGPLETINEYYKGIKIQRLNEFGEPIEWDQDNGGSHHYYFEFRRPVGFDSDAPYIDGVMVRLNNNPFSPFGGSSLLLDMSPHHDAEIGQEEDSFDVVLREGELFFDPYTNFHIEVISISEEFATVNIAEGFPDVYAEITVPEYLNPVSGNVNIYGTVSGDGYTLEYKREYAPEWITIGTYDITQNLVNELLATWNTNGLEEGYYLLRLTSSFDGEDYVEEIKVYYIIGVQDGWPKIIGEPLTAPSFEDIDNDYDLEVFTGASFGVFGSGLVYGWYHNGDLLGDGWPIEARNNIKTSPSIGDVDGDGEDDVIIAHSTYCSNCDWEVEAFHLNGESFANWPYDLENNAGANAVVVEDITQDLINDVIYTSGNNLHVLNGDGSLLWKYPVSSIQAPAVGDIDNDGDMEIVVGGYSKTFVFDHNGNVLPNWPKSIGSKSSPIIANVDANGEKEIILKGSDSKVYVWDINGDSLYGWPVTCPNSEHSELVVGDIDDDGDLEIFSGTEDGKAYGWHYYGTLINNWPIEISDESFELGFALADVNSDEKIDIIMPSTGEYIYVYGSGGYSLDGWPKEVPDNIHREVGVADIDNDGDVELMAVTEAGAFHIWDLQHNYNPEYIEWPMLHYNARHTSCYKCDNCFLLQERLEYAMNTYCQEEEYDAVVDINKDEYVNSVDQDLFDANEEQQWCFGTLNNLFNPCACDILLLMIQDAMGSQVGDENYEPMADINIDGYVNQDDLDLYYQSIQQEGEIWCTYQVEDSCNVFWGRLIDSMYTVCDYTVDVDENGELDFNEPGESVPAEFSQIFDDFDTLFNVYDAGVDVKVDGQVDAGDFGLFLVNKDDTAWCSEQLNRYIPTCSCWELDYRVTLAYDTTCEHEEYDFLADINKDTYVNLDDRSEVDEHFDLPETYDYGWCQERLDDATDPCGACETLFAILLDAYPSECGDANYDYRADVDPPNEGNQHNDGDVDGIDAGWIGYYWAEGDLDWCQAELDDDYDPCWKVPQQGESHGQP